MLRQQGFGLFVQRANDLGINIVALGVEQDEADRAGFGIDGINFQGIPAELGGFALGQVFSFGFSEGVTDALD